MKSKKGITLTAILLVTILLTFGCAIKYSDTKSVHEFSNYLIDHNGKVYYTNDYEIRDGNVEFTGFYHPKTSSKLFLITQEYIYYPNYRLLSGNYSILELSEKDKERLFKGEEK